MNVQVKSTKTSSLRIALNAAIVESKIPFYIYDASFFKGEGELEGDWTVVSEDRESEYAIVIEGVQKAREERSIAGKILVPYTAYKIYYPFFDKGDPTVGLDDAWIIDFEEDEPDYVAENVSDAAIHVVNWFINREIYMRIDEALYRASTNEAKSTLINQDRCLRGKA